MDFVDAQRNREFALGRALCRCQQEGREVILEVAALGRAWLGRNREFKFQAAQVAFGFLVEGVEEAAQHPKAAAGVVAGAAAGILTRSVEIAMQGGQQQLGQRLAFSCFELNGMQAVLLGVVVYRIDNNSLTCSTKPHHHDALGVEAVAQPDEGQLRVAQNQGPARQLRRLRACSRCEGIGAGVHANTLASYTRKAI